MRDVNIDGRIGAVRFHEAIRPSGHWKNWYRPRSSLPAAALSSMLKTPFSDTSSKTLRFF